MLALFEYFWDSTAWAGGPPPPPPTVTATDQSDNPVKQVHQLHGLEKL